jgi:hypothetical protein
MRDDSYFEMFETANSLSEFYTEQIGRTVEFGFDNSYDLWVRTPRTNGKEYFEHYATAEERVKQLHPDVFLDDDYEDPLQGI